MKKVAIVLSGGGARGAYQMGVWKALRRLKIKYDIVTGTSIGSINGMLMVQNDYYKAYKMWNTINYKLIFNKDYSLFKGKKLYFNYMKDVISNKGLDTKEIEKMVRKLYNLKKFKDSKINYGLVTYNFSNLKPLMLKKENIDYINLPNYIVASSSIAPFLKPKKIDDLKYVDGCYYENMPINLAIELGATDIIAVNIGTFGRKQKVINKNVNIKYIIPKNDILTFLEFNSKDIKKGISFGYNDTLKIFGKLEGNKFSFRKNELKKSYESYYNKYIELLDKCNYLKLFKMKKNYEFTYEKYVNLIEYIGTLFELNESKIYRIDEFNNKILKKYDRIEASNSLSSSCGFIKYIINKIELKEKIFNIFDKDYTSAIYILMILGGIE